MTKHIDLDALQALADEFDTFLNEPPAYEQERMVRDYRHAAYPKWAKVESGMRTLIARIRELEGDTGKSADSERLDWLENMANQPGGILLHDGGDFTGRLGLGLRRIGRSLRQAINAAKSAGRAAPEGDTPQASPQAEAKSPHVEGGKEGGE